MIHPFRSTLTCVMAAAWVAVIADAAIDVLHYKASVTLALAASTATLFVALRWHVSRLEAATQEHAARVEAATREHAKAIAAQVLTVERFFKIGVRSDTMAKIDAARTPNGHDTGPFQAVGRGLG